MIVSGTVRQTYAKEELVAEMGAVFPIAIAFLLFTFQVVFQIRPNRDILASPDQGIGAAGVVGIVW
jgi:hypothetical protein